MSHLCASGRSCREPVIIDGKRTPATISDRRGLCRRCYTNVKTAAAELDSDHRRLCAAVGERLSKGEVFVHGTPDPSIPINTTVLALSSSLAEWAEAALWMMAESLGIDVKERHKAKGWPVRDGPVIIQASRIIPENLKVLLAANIQPVSVWTEKGWAVEELDGIAVALKLAQLHNQVYSVLGEANPRRRLAMPCPVFDCGVNGSLGIDNGETDVSCTACGGRWTVSEYDWLAHMLVVEHKKEETQMLQWLLAESEYRATVLKWLVAERDHRLWQLSRLAGMREEDLAGIDGYAVVELLREMLGGKASDLHAA